MRILIIHNCYQQPGGEDVVAAREADLLREAGHDVIWYQRSNAEIEALDAMGKVRLAMDTVWARDSAAELKTLLRDSRPDLAHIHNTFVRISPSAYYACAEFGVPVVQSLHNPRLMCPAASFYRAGHTCEDCLGRPIPWPGVLHGCYHGSRAQSAVVAAMLTTHRLLGTWQRRVNAYIVFTEFYRRKFISAGLPAENLFVKPHFVAPDPGERTGGAGEYALFVGRLDPEKGVRTLLTAWRSLPDVPLKIRGEGQLHTEVQEALGRGGAIELVPRLEPKQLVELVKGARFLVWPSEGHYETFGLVAGEAFGCGVPVIASNIGVPGEIVRHQETGLHFSVGEPEALAQAVRWAWMHPDAMAAMGRCARREFEVKYTPDRNYRILAAIYRRALGR
jgi:glycosyltransferase involved in cell wall biosynthesis